MKFNIISNIDNGYGLQRDYEILKAILEDAGHYVNGIQFQQPVNQMAVDVNIFLETVIPLHHMAKENWYFPNPEWFELGLDGKYLGQFDRVLCKTHNAFDVFSRYTDKAEYIGFESIDRFRPGVIRKRKFIHVAGNSIVKSTDAILKAWIDYRIPFDLTMITRRPGFFDRSIYPNIRHIFRVAQDGDLSDMLNYHAFNLCPSQCEGWGHCIHEALGAGQVVITTAAPPMNEFYIPGNWFVGVRGSKPLRLARIYDVQPADIATAVNAAVRMTDKEIEQQTHINRDAFIQNRADFRGRFLKIVEEATGRLAA